VLLAVVAAPSVSGSIGRPGAQRGRRHAENATAEAAIAVVNVVSPKPNAAAQEILLPGTTQAFTDRRSSRAPTAT